MTTLLVKSSTCYCDICCLKAGTHLILHVKAAGIQIMFKGKHRVDKVSEMKVFVICKFDQNWILKRFKDLKTIIEGAAILNI